MESGADREGVRDAFSAKYRSEMGNLERAMGETSLDSSILVTLTEEGDVQTDTGVVHVVPAWKWFLSRG